MRYVVLAILATALGAATPAQTPLADRSIEELVDALVEEDGAVGAQVELWRRGGAPPALGEAVLRGWSGNPRDLVGRGAAARVLMELAAGGAGAFAALEQCVRDPYVPDDAVRYAADALIVIAPFAGEDGREFVGALLDVRRPVYSGYRRELFASWTAIVSSVDLDGREASLDELLAVFDATNPYALATACRALVARRDEFVGSTRRIVDVLGGVVDAEFEPGSRWGWQVAGRNLSWSLSVDSVRWLRTTAALALCAYAPEDDRALLGYSQRLFHLDPDVCVAAADWLARKRRPDAGRWLLDAARAGTERTALASLDAIQRIGPSLRHLGPELVELERTAESPVAEAAQRAHRVLAPELEDARPIQPLLEILGSGIPERSPIRIAAEQRRLEAWLDAGGGRYRHALQDDVRAIDLFHALASEDGGPADRNMRWVPVLVAPDELRPGFWDVSLRERIAGVVSAAASGVVGPKRERLRPLPWVVELIPTDRREPTFTHEQVERLVSSAWSGRISYSFRLRGEHAAEMTGLKAALYRRDGALLHVVDGLAVWVRPIEENEAFDHPGGGFAIRPGAESRQRVLEQLLVW